MKISASFLKIQNEKEKIKELDKISDYIHFDIMDGKFVFNKTIGYEEMRQLSEKINSPKDIHLMVSDIYDYVDMYKQLNPEYIIFHFEAVKEINNVIDYIKNLGIKVGIALNPDTNPKVLYEYLKKIDLVLLMSVYPGKGGQKFIDVSKKLKFLNDARDKHNDFNYLIEVDGGINDQTIKLVKKADMVVVGSFITDSDDYNKQFNQLKKGLQ